MYQDWSMGNPCFGGMGHQPPCVPYENVITNVKLARAYVPFQKLCTLYPPDIALQKGTVFPELYSPYLKKKDFKTSPLMEECGDDDE